ncbi:hypothetical protein CCP2SC5_1390004 [Azospirillaceae bacterium]
MGHRSTEHSQHFDVSRACLSVDAGPNIAASLRALGIGLSEVDGIFHTHCHDDHFCGLATLLRSDRRLKYWATPLVRHSVMKKLAALVGIHGDRLDEYFDFHDLHFGHWNDVEGLEVMPLFSPHPVETNIFIFRTMWIGEYRTYAHFADISSLDVLREMIVDDPKAPGISQVTFEKVCSDYYTSADIKKLDIGGGMIHGNVFDFIDDSSGKLILAHTSRPLTNEEKTVGSGAPFGTVDVLISANQDYAWRYAYEFLRSYFPSVSASQIRILMNNQKKLFNPETILIRQGTPVRAIYLVLTGSVEIINSATNVCNTVSAGSLLGELTGLHGLPAIETCRAASFVEAMCLPCDLYLEFVKRNDLFASISRLSEYRDFLTCSRLCGEITTTASLNRIAATLSRLLLNKQTRISSSLRGFVSLIKSGQVLRLIDDRVVETIGPGDFFGEDVAIYETPLKHRLEVSTPTDIYMIPPDVIKNIPGVRWKLLEAFQRRRTYA